MEMNNEVPERGLQNQNRSPNNQSKGSKGKSCKGCLYYSSAQNSKFQNPTCVGISKTLQVPSSILGESESKASKEGDSLTEFRYTCVGYSLYLDNRDSSTDQQDKRAELPFCAGLEVLLRKKPSSADHAPAPAHGNEDGHGIPQPQTYKPAHSIVDEYLSRFKRNASIVALGVVKDAIRMANYIRDSPED